MKVGTKLVLHSIPFPEHHPNDIDKFVEIEILEEVPNVPCTWTGKKEYTGYRAMDKDGNIYECNTDTFPTDSMTPYWMWIKKDSQTHEDAIWYDVVGEISYLKRKPPFLDNYMDILGYCEIHKRIYYRDKNLQGGEEEHSLGKGCGYCYIEKTYKKESGRPPVEKICGGW